MKNATLRTCLFLSDGTENYICLGLDFSASPKGSERRKGKEKQY